jgi:hypothetical protein
LQQADLDPSARQLIVCPIEVKAFVAGSGLDQGQELFFNPAGGARVLPKLIEIGASSARSTPCAVGKQSAQANKSDRQAGAEIDRGVLPSPEVLLRGSDIFRSIRSLDAGGKHGSNDVGRSD